MNQHSIEAIKPLIQTLNIQGRTVAITFQCPVTGKQFSARHHQQQDRTIGGQAMKSFQRSAMYAIQTAVSQAIRSVFGYNLLGRTAGDITRQTISGASRNLHNSMSTKEQEQAIVKAFQSVAKNFVWDEKNARWVSAQGLQNTLSPFDQQCNQYPVKHPYDLQTLSRMLVEVASVDGTITKEESDWLINMLDPAHGSIESISKRPSLSNAELNQTSAGGVRETMLMLTWSLALCDEDFADSERQLLLQYGKNLGLSALQIGAVQSKAQQYILENALEYMFASGTQDHFSRQHLLELSSKIGLSQREAMEVEAKFQRRKA